MNRRFAITLAASLLFAPVAPNAAHSTVAKLAYAPVANVSVSMFYGDLSPWGRWVDMPSYGWCWVPDDVYAGWRPYTDGGWVYTDLGWTWESDEPWAWATYHYGRWYHDSFYGWVWVPGTEWAPAWVVWRTDYEWIGWAPLPPTVGWSAWFEVRSSDFVNVQPRAWCFTRVRDMGSRNLRDRIEPFSRNANLVRRTRDATRFDRKDGRPFVRGVDVAQLERRSGTRIQRSVIRDVSGPRERGRGGRDGSIGFYRPDVRRGSPGERPNITEQRRERDRRFAADPRSVRPGDRPDWKRRAEPAKVRERSRPEEERVKKPEPRQPPRGDRRDRRDRDRGGGNDRDDRNDRNDKERQPGPGDMR